MAVTKHRMRKSRKVHKSRKSRKSMRGGVGSSSPTRRSSSEKRSFERRETERAAHTVRVLKGIADRKAADVEAKKIAQEVAAAAKKAAQTAAAAAKRIENIAIESFFLQKVAR